jgi:hypothetical protein
VQRIPLRRGNVTQRADDAHLRHRGGTCIRRPCRGTSRHRVLPCSRNQPR